MVSSKLYSCLKSYIASFIILTEVHENNTPECSHAFLTFFFFSGGQDQDLSGIFFSPYLSWPYK